LAEGKYVSWKAKESKAQDALDEGAGAAASMPNVYATVFAFTFTKKSWSNKLD